MSAPQLPLPELTLSEQPGAGESAAIGSSGVLAKVDLARCVWRVRLRTTHPVTKDNIMSSTPHSMLVVDDDEGTCLNLADIFSDLGYCVETALNGPMALEKVQRRCFEVALLDLMLPGMDGLLLYQAVHKLCHETVALLITGEPHHPRAAECLRAGMRCVIPKPLDIPPLASLLAEIAS